MSASVERRLTDIESDLLQLRHRMDEVAPESDPEARGRGWRAREADERLTRIESTLAQILERVSPPTVGGQ